MAAESASAAVILTSSHLGFALSTTHVATGSILGTGLGRSGAQVRWAVAARMLVAWMITLPAAGLVGAVMFVIGNTIGGLAGPLVIFALLCALAGYMFLRARRQPVTAGNVNEEWDGATADTPAGAVTTTGSH